MKKLHSVESLRSVSVICSDKTGTLTKNDQTVTEAYAVDETIFLDPTSIIPYTGSVSPAIKRALGIGALCNNASLEMNEDGVFVGQSTDVAFLNVLQIFGLPDRREVCPLLLFEDLFNLIYLQFTDLPSVIQSSHLTPRGSSWLSREFMKTRQ